MLEVLSRWEHAVAEMLPQVGVEPVHRSQQLAALRRAEPPGGSYTGCGIEIAAAFPAGSRRRAQSAGVCCEQA